VLLVAQLGFHIGTASTFSTIGKVPTPVLIELFVGYVTGVQQLVRDVRI
jgi:hypothetical protein